MWKQFERTALNIFKSIFRLSPNYYNLIAGILISTSVTLLTSDFINKMFIAVSLMVSAFFLSVISMNLETLHDLFITAPDEFLDPNNDEFEERTNKVWRKIYDPHLKKLSGYLLVAFISALLSLYFMRISH